MTSDSLGLVKGGSVRSNDETPGLDSLLWSAPAGSSCVGCPATGDGEGKEAQDKVGEEEEDKALPFWVLGFGLWIGELR